MKTLWENHTPLVIGFVLALMLTVFLLVRLIANLVYWPQHQDAEIAGWMTVRYVAQSYDVNKDSLMVALDLETDIRRHLMLTAIADAKNLPLMDIQIILLDAIATERAK